MWTQRCTEQVTYWATEILSGRDAGFDYQEMGLSGTTNDALQALLVSGKEKRPSATWVNEHAADECRSRAGEAAKKAGTRASGWP